MVQDQQHVMLTWAWNSFLYTYIFVCFASVLTAAYRNDHLLLFFQTILSDSVYL